MNSYKFPSEFLKQPTKKYVQQRSVILVNCGSFNPVTSFHLRMFENAKDFLLDKYKIDVVGGFISPVNDGFKKKGLLSSDHRCAMLDLALEDSEWVKLDRWEANQKTWKTAREVLNHFVEEGKKFYGGEFENVKVSLLCGADLLKSFMIPKLWEEEDIRYILGTHGVVCLERVGVDLNELIFENDILYQYSNNIHVIPSLITNDISSTKIRRFVRRGYSTKYLISDKVGKYIDDNKLYRGDNETELSDLPQEKIEIEKELEKKKEKVEKEEDKEKVTGKKRKRDEDQDIGNEEVEKHQPANKKQKLS